MPGRAAVLAALLLLLAVAVRMLLAPRRQGAALRMRSVAGAGLLAAAMCLAAWFSAQQAEALPTGAGSVLHAGSTLDATARGASGFYVLLDRLGVRVRRLARPWPPPHGVRAL